jgi:putative transposase
MVRGAAMADGTIEPNPQIGKWFERRLEIRQRRLSRKQKGSKN